MPTRVFLVGVPGLWRLRFRRALSFVAIAAVLILSPLIQASGPLISELVEQDELRRAIASSTPREFESAITLTPGQLDSSRLLIDGARTELERVINRHLRQTRAGCTIEELRASEISVMELARKIERQLLEDLRSLLNPDQLAEFEKFERARRRGLLIGDEWTPLPLDLIAWLRASGVDTNADPELRAAVERYDVEGDRVIVEYAEARREYFKIMRGGYDGSPEAIAAQTKARRRFDVARVAMDRFQATTLKAVMPRLNGAAQDRFVKACVPAKTLAFFGSTLDPANRPVVREVRRMKLTEAQRASLDALVSAAERAALDRTRQFALDNATYVLASEDYRQKQRTTPSNMLLEDLGKVEKKLDADALALLTEQQRSEYDASPVIDPSDVSPIKPEPAER